MKRRASSFQVLACREAKSSSLFGVAKSYTLKAISYRASRGFTLIELLVSVAIFSIVMLIAAGSLLSMIEANRKAQSLKSVVNNLSFALDGMSRTFRDGRTLHCGAGDVNLPADCASSGATLLAVERYGGISNNASDQYVYCRGSITTSTCDDAGTSILRSTTGSAGPFYPITSPEVTITELRFYVVGSSRTDQLQPRVVMILRGVAGASARTRTEIKLQTTMTQRLFDE